MVAYDEVMEVYFGGKVGSPCCRVLTVSSECISMSPQVPPVPPASIACIQRKSIHQHIKIKGPVERVFHSDAITQTTPIHHEPGECDYIDIHADMEDGAPPLHPSKHLVVQEHRFPSSSD
jgi:hypothetical protein